MMNMKQILLLFAWAFAMTAVAQTAEVDSINVDDLYNTEAADTIDCADLETPDIPQIPFEELDSITMSSLDDRYVVVYKDGKCGVYDLLKEENVTRIEYEYLSMGLRKEFEREFYTYFRLINDGNEGILGIVETNNQFIAVMMPKEEEK